MKSINKGIHLLLLGLLLSVLLPLTVNAQPLPDANDPDEPLDGGISLLVAAGAAIGAKKVHDKRKK